MRTPRLLPMLAFLMLAVPVASAGTPDDPEVTDPSGDAGPAPAGSEWADIVAAWFPEVDGGTLVAVIDVVGIVEPAGEVGLLFTVGDRSWIAGWTTIVFPAPPFVYGGGFYCPADADGTVPDASLCGSVEATRDESAYTIRLPRATLGLADGTVLRQPRGYATDVVSAQPGLGQEWIEETAPGRDYALPAAPSSAPAIQASEGPVPTTAAAPLPSSAPDAGPGPRESPALALPLAGLAVLLLALARRRMG